MWTNRDFVRNCKRKVTLCCFPRVYVRKANTTNKANFLFLLGCEDSDWHKQSGTSEADCFFFFTLRCAARFPWLSHPFQEGRYILGLVLSLFPCLKSMYNLFLSNPFFLSSSFSFRPKIKHSSLYSFVSHKRNSDFLPVVTGKWLLSVIDLFFMLMDRLCHM